MPSAVLKIVTLHLVLAALLSPSCTAPPLTTGGGSAPSAYDACSEKFCTGISNQMYKHEALANRESIRLLRILPRQIQDSAQYSEESDREILAAKDLAERFPNRVFCRIKEYDRQHLTEKYIALSYVWGDTESPISVFLNGQVAHVTKNLHAALLNLRDAYPGSLFWIDALCIDQADPSERNHQVAQMRTIYSKAIKVVSWLGPCMDYVGSLFAFIESHRKACTYSQSNTSGHSIPASQSRSYSSLRSIHSPKSNASLRSTTSIESIVAKRPITPPRLSNHFGLYTRRNHPPLSLEIFAKRPNKLASVRSAPDDQVCGCSLHPTLLQAIQQIEQQPYWDRVWIIQEIVVARKVILMCGQSVVSWSSFVKFLRLLSNDHFQPSVPKHMNRGSACSRRSSILRLGRWPYETIDLAHALNWSTVSQATDVRDRVYALLGLVNDGHGKLLIPDYNLSPCTVFCLALRAMLKDWHHLLSGHPTFESAHITQFRYRIKSQARGVARACLDNGLRYANTGGKDNTKACVIGCEGKACGSESAMWSVARWNKLVVSNPDEQTRSENMRWLFFDLSYHPFWSSLITPADFTRRADPGSAADEAESASEESSIAASDSDSWPIGQECPVCLQNAYMRERLRRKRLDQYLHGTCGACKKSWVVSPLNLDFGCDPVSMDKLLPDFDRHCPACHLHLYGSKITFATFQIPTHVECSGCQAIWYCIEDDFDYCNFCTAAPSNPTTSTISPASTPSFVRWDDRKERSMVVHSFTDALLGKMRHAYSKFERTR